MYKIYMYNDWFGDCFRLNDGAKNIFIDFGIHQGCLSGGIHVTINNYSSGTTIKRDDVHKTIADEIVSYENSDLLVTHYHLDHISGLLYMKNKGYCSPIFNKVYLPDIWNLPDSKSIVALLILKDLMDNCKLNKRECTLLEFVNFLCTNVKNVELLRRGEKFDGDNFVTLWPDQELVGAMRKKVDMIEAIDMLRDIINIAEELIGIVKIVVSQGIDDEERKACLVKFENLRERIEDIYDEDILIGFIDKYDILLNALGNDISIVFQNVTSNDNNMLFTGDLSSSYISMLSNNYDKKLPMHKKYKYIKIPHHGTKGANDSHYYDFSTYEPDVLIFPNGECSTSSYKISNNYKKDITSIASKGIIKVYCSNSNYCEMNKTGKACDCQCGASVTNIVFPNISMEVM